MNAITADTQLEYELQDLYISSQHWFSDVSFATDEIRFFHNVINKYFNPDIQNSRRTRCKIMLFRLQTQIVDLKLRVINHLSFLAPYINGTQKLIGTDLIEKHSLLKNDIQVLFESVKLLKSELFALTTDILDDEKNLFI